MGLVGDDALLFLDSGLNKAVAGEALAFWNNALAGDDPGGVVKSFPPAELRATVCIGENPEAVEEVLWRTGLEGVRDWLDAAFGVS